MCILRTKGNRDTKAKFQTGGKKLKVVGRREQITRGISNTTSSQTESNSAAIIALTIPISTWAFLNSWGWPFIFITKTANERKISSLPVSPD